MRSRKIKSGSESKVKPKIISFNIREYHRHVDVKRNATMKNLSSALFFEHVPFVPENLRA